MTKTCAHVFFGVLLAGLASLGGCNGARDTAVNMLEKQRPYGFMIEEVQNSGRTRKYGLFVPPAYNPKVRYPVIIFLHGLGEGGNDATANLRVGLAPYVAEHINDFRFIVIFPQSPDGQWGDDAEVASDVIAILDEVSRRYSVDDDCVSLTGISTGGYGTWMIGAKYRDRFSALAPMATFNSAAGAAEALLNVPVRCYHNQDDAAAAMAYDMAMVDRVNMLGGRAELIHCAASGHNCWDYAYARTDIFDWMREQRRRRGFSPRR